MMAAQGVDIDRSTLAGWTGQGAALLDPIVARIRDMVLSASKLHTDDTPVPMLDPGSGKTKTARLWVHAIDDRAHGGLAKPAVWFAFTTDRRAEHPKSMLKDFRGHLQADAYPGYDDLYRTGRIVEVGCWGHARRKIFDLHENRPTAVTTELLERIARLYNVEEDVRGQPPDTRRATRQAQAKPQLDALKARMEAIRAKLSTKSTLAVAITYTLKRWPALTRYCEDGCLEIDNLIAERALRGVAIGRRNWLFTGSKAGGERAAAIYSIIETCKLNGVEPFAYISCVMQRIAEGWPNTAASTNSCHGPGAPSLSRKPHDDLRFSHDAYQRPCRGNGDPKPERQSGYDDCKSSAIREIEGPGGTEGRRHPRARGARAHWPSPTS